MTWPFGYTRESGKVSASSALDCYPGAAHTSRRRRLLLVRIGSSTESRAAEPAYALLEATQAAASKTAAPFRTGHAYRNARRVLRLRGAALSARAQ
ncbi:hypothetical protein MRX96_049210 [Rhipicephalus microplus]